MLEAGADAMGAEARGRRGLCPHDHAGSCPDEVLLGAGFAPRGDENANLPVEQSDLSLIGTAEIPLGGYHMNEIIDENKLPLKYVGLSHCFRTEAGTYGRESYDLIAYTSSPKSSSSSLPLRGSQRRCMRSCIVWKKWCSETGLTFRTVDICTGDLGGPAYRKYDLEAWMWGRTVALPLPEGE